MKGTFSKHRLFTVYSLDNFHRDVCNCGPVDSLWPRWSEPSCPQSRNGLPAPLSSFAADTATSPRWRTTESNRGNRFTARPAQVVNAVDGTAAQSRIDELERQLTGQQAQIQDLQERLEQAVEITRDKQDEFASVAQAEGVSLNVARRLLQVVGGSVTIRSVPTLGRATEEAGKRAGALLEVLDEMIQTQDHSTDRRRDFFPPSRF